MTDHEKVCSVVFDDISLRAGLAILKIFCFVLVEFNDAFNTIRLCKRLSKGKT